MKNPVQRSNQQAKRQRPLALEIARDAPRPHRLRDRGYIDCHLRPVPFADSSPRDAAAVSPQRQGEKKAKDLS